MLQQIAADQSADIDYRDFVKIYRKCSSEPYSFLTNLTLPGKNFLTFRKDLLLPYKNDIN